MRTKQGPAPRRHNGEAGRILEQRDRTPELAPVKSTGPSPYDIEQFREALAGAVRRRELRRTAFYSRSLEAALGRVTNE